MKQHKDITFGGIYIPREVFNSELSPMAKLLYGVIQCLDGEDGCYASNAYLSEVCGISESTVKEHISNLIEANFIVRHEAYGETRVIRTCGSEAMKGGARKSATPSRKIGYPPAEKSATYIQDKDKKNREDTKGDAVALPHGELFKKAWLDWEQYRREKKKPLTKTTITLQLGDMTSLSEPEAIATITTSMRNGWLGLFPPQRQSGGVKRVTTREEHSNGF
jgi:hypothetical protein